MLAIHYRLKSRVLALLAALAVLASVLASAVGAQAAPITRYTGVIDGAAYLIEVPATWNGTVVLYSHGYTVGPDNPARDVGDPITGGWLLDHGYALAGSSYSRTGWALAEAFHDQIALLNAFDGIVGQHPQQTIAWGHSLGGIITAGLVQLFPERFVGALPMCGVLAGGVGVWNVGLDGAFVFKTLLAQGAPVQLVRIQGNPLANFALAQQILRQVQETAAGRARLALVAAVGDLPGWFDPLSPEPAADDFDAREINQFRWNDSVDFFFSFAARAELEARAGGNPSWNSGVDYRKQLDRSINRDEVEALYERAGLSLEEDLDTLERATRIDADPQALDYLSKNIIFNGELSGRPVLTMHTSGDGLVQVENEAAYADVVRAAESKKLLRQTFVHRAGHCTFTPAETITAFQTLVQRIGSGKWHDTDEPEVLNARARALGPGFSVLPPGVPVGPAFFEFEPGVFLRPFDSRSSRDE